MFNTLFSNNATTTLATSIGTGDTVISLSPGTGSKFPSVGANQHFYATIFNTNNVLEIVKVVDRSTDTITVERGQEGTTAKAWNPGDLLELRLTAAGISELVSYIDALSAQIENMSDEITNLSSSLVPPGSILALSTSTVPTGYLEAAGQNVSRNTYAALFAVIGTLYGSGDGTSTFTLPDYRGRFMRGWNHGSGFDPDAVTRTGGDTVGSTQADAIKAHKHDMDMGLQGIAEGGAWAWGDREAGQWGNPSPCPMNSIVCQFFGGNETRPANTAVMYCIKY